MSKYQLSLVKNITIHPSRFKYFFWGFMMVLPLFINIPVSKGLYLPLGSVFVFLALLTTHNLFVVPLYLPDKTAPLLYFFLFLTLSLAWIYGSVSITEGIGLSIVFLFQWPIPFFSYLLFVYLSKNTVVITKVIKSMTIGVIVSSLLLVLLARMLGYRSDVVEGFLILPYIHVWQIYQYIPQIFSGFILAFLFFENKITKTLFFIVLFFLLFYVNLIFCSETGKIVFVLGLTFWITSPFWKKFSPLINFLLYWSFLFSGFFLSLFFKLTDFGQRTHIWGHFQDVLLTRPLLGWAFNSPDGIKLRGHNQIVNVFLQGGLPAIIVLSIIIIYISWKAFKLIGSSCPNNIALPISFFLLSQVTLTTITTVPFEQPFSGSLIWANLALAEGLLRIYGNNTKSG